METFFSIVGTEIVPRFRNYARAKALESTKLGECMPQLQASKGILIYIDTKDAFDGQWSTDGTIPSGIRLAQELRLKNIRKPIMFVSHKSRNEVSKKESQLGIINTIGHSFKRLNVNSNELILDCIDTMHDLDDLELYDIQNYYCRKDGIVEELSHKLDSSIRYPELDVFITTIQDIAGVYNEDPSLFLEQFLSKFPVIDDTNFSEAVLDVKSYGKKLIRDSSAEDNDNDSEVLPDKKRNRILWVDDEAEKDHPLILALQKRGVEVILYGNALEALRYLEEDWKGSNDVSLVLADYRLNETLEGISVQQRLQGYKLLNMIARSGHIVSLAALSARHRKFLFKSFRYFNVRTEIFPKSEYLNSPDGMRILVEELIALVDRNQETIKSMPRSSGWAYLRPAYVEYIHSFEYDALEQDISIAAAEIVAHYERTYTLGHIFTFNKSTFKMNKDTSVNLEHLTEILLARRVVLWLWLKKGLSNAEVATLLRGELAGDYNVMLSQALGLRNEFPFGLTLEEKNWFQYYIGYPIYREIQNAETLLDQIAREFRAFIEKIQGLADLLKKHGRKVSFTSETYSAEIFFTADIMPRLQSYAEARALCYIAQRWSDALPQANFISLLRSINGCINRHFEKNTDNPAFLNFARFFKRELQRQEARPQLNENDRQIVARLYTAIENGRQPKIGNDHELELYTNIYLVLHTLKKAPDKSFPSLQEIEKTLADELAENQRHKKESRKLTRDNQTRTGKNLLDFNLHGDSLTD
ncbi:MAG TPA: hypothetical protein VIM55_17105 [Mucilaginibacter sp.]